MISRIHGTLAARELDRVEVLTPGGVGYELAIPRSVYERLPPAGKEVELRTVQVVREDAVLLFGFLEEVERQVFSRLVRAIRERDIAALTAVSGVGRKTAERLALDLANKLDDIAIPASGLGAHGAGVEEALRALTVLGFSVPDADRAVRTVLQERGPLEAQELIRAALLQLR